ncbi:MAG: hypothetical protein R3B47_04540 [Bacteroidia bacterium]
MNRIAFFIISFLALGVFAVVSFVITVFAWVGPAPRISASLHQSSRLKDDDPVMLQPAL